MNWLAHLYLSEPNAEFRIGNLLPDLTSASRLAGLAEPYQKGIRRHRRIDAFTDSHATFRSCVRRFPPPYRRYGGILTDVYFDHFLARDWPTYSDVSLAQFGEVHRDVGTCIPAIPAETTLPLLRMREENWLASYDTIAGVTGNPPPHRPPLPPPLRPDGLHPNLRTTRSRISRRLPRLLPRFEETCRNRHLNVSRGSVEANHRDPALSFRTAKR